MTLDRQVDRQAVNLAVLAAWRLGYLQVTAKLVYREMAVKNFPIHPFVVLPLHSHTWRLPNLRLTCNAM